MASRFHKKPFLVELVKAAEIKPKIVFNFPVPEPKPIIDPLSSETHIIDIHEAICRKFGIRLNELLSPRKPAYLVIPRQVSWILCRLLTIQNYSEIGRRTGNRDHTTVLHGMHKFNWLYEQLNSELTLFDPLSRWVERAHEILVDKGLTPGKA